MKTIKMLVMAVFMGAIVLVGSGCKSVDKQTNDFTAWRQSGIRTVDPKTGEVKLSGPMVGDRQHEEKSVVKTQDPVTYTGHIIGGGMHMIGGLLHSAFSAVTCEVYVDHPYAPPMMYTTYYPLFPTRNYGGGGYHGGRREVYENQPQYRPQQQYCPPPRILPPIRNGR